MTTLIHIIDELKIGGAQTHLLTMLRHAVHTYPFEHHVISLFGDGPIGESLRAFGVEVTALNLRPHLARRRFDAAISEIASLLKDRQPDLVEAHLTWSRLLGLAAARRAGIDRRVGFEQGDLYLNSAKFRLANFLSQLYIDRYIVCSYALRDWVRQTHRIRDHKITVLHNCVDTQHFHPQVLPAPDVAALRQNSDALLVMVGTLGQGVNKRVDIGIRALANAREQGVPVSLAIAGDGPLRGSLETLAAQLGVAESVHFLGMRDDIPAVLAAGDIFCHAAPFEPFGIVALEAMAVGRPVIVPNTGGIQEAVIHKVTGLIYPALDISSFARAIAELSRNDLMRKNMGVVARRIVEKQFAAQRYVEQLYTLYGLEI